MLELDILLQEFLKQHWEGMDDSERQAFGRLLDYADAVVLECLMGRLPVQDPEIARVIARIRQHAAD
jgi:succinate dehydrogenase flavin-adding protein (antitoxin of CptAB toxin-antitoxin module)